MPDDPMQMMLGLGLGVALAAASGLRVFLPLLVLNIAALNGSLPVELGENWQWLGSPLGTVIFGTATAAEIAAYYVPWLDNLLDTIATPSAALAGTVVTAALLGEVDPALKWVMAAIAGGGAAGTIQLFTVGARAASSGTTAGVGNPIVSTAEAGGSLLVCIVAMIVPLVVGVLALLAVAWLLGRLVRRGRRRPDSDAPPSAPTPPAAA